MPSTAGGYAANAVRFALAAVGAILAVGAVVALLRVPPPPPGSDGFPAGMAFLFGGLVFILGLALRRFSGRTTSSVSVALSACSCRPPVSVSSADSSVAWVARSRSGSASACWSSSPESS